VIRLVVGRYLGIAKQELMAMLEEEELKDATLLVFANKQDAKGALNSRHVREEEENKHAVVLVA
jgi:hypothetical protein